MQEQIMGFLRQIEIGTAMSAAGKIDQVKPQERCDLAE